MLKQTVERRDGETVEIWLSDECPDNETVNGMLDLQLNGIKTFYKALERNGKIWLGGVAAGRPKGRGISSFMSGYRSSEPRITAWT
jgi:hypothetical protein